MCGVAFTTTDARIECCGLACGRALGKQRSDAARRANADDRRRRRFECCGVAFVALNPGGKARRGESNEGRFCSRACAQHFARFGSKVDQLGLALEREGAGRLGGKGDGG